MYDLRGFYETFDRKFDGEIPKSFSKLCFTKFSMTPENGKANLAKLLRRVANRGEYDLCFASAGFASGDAENADGRDRAV